MKKLLLLEHIKTNEKSSYIQLGFKAQIDGEIKEIRFNINDEYISEILIENINKLIAEKVVINVDESNIEHTQGIFKDKKSNNEYPYNFYLIKKPITTLNNNESNIKFYDSLTASERLMKKIKLS